MASINKKKIIKIPQITKKKTLNKKIYEKANELNKSEVKIHCAVDVINNHFLHKLREKVSPAVIYFGKKSVLRKVIDLKFEQNSFIIFTDLKNKEKILDLLKEERVTSFPSLEDNGEINIESGPLPFPSSFYKTLKKFNLNVMVENGNLILKNDFRWEGVINREIINLYKLLNLRTQTCPLRVLDVIS
ncbi:hypothetical protein CDIK_0019 [Cucumispora dikerogammari]|nr:hypothetical protein CDIK_0019 [Cucumispora dikerogammari]